MASGNSGDDNNDIWNMQSKLLELFFGLNSDDSFHENVTIYGPNGPITPQKLRSPRDEMILKPEVPQETERGNISVDQYPERRPKITQNTLYYNNHQPHLDHFGGNFDPFGGVFGRIFRFDDLFNPMEQIDLPGNNSFDPNAPIQPGQQEVIRSHFSQKSFSRVIGPDGRVEEHRTERDSTGNLCEVVTKRLGDQEYTVTTKRKLDGSQEVEEQFSNIPDGGESSFKTTWDAKPSPDGTDRNSIIDFSKLYPPKPSNSNSWLQKLHSWWKS